jgi:uncharacterized protein YqgQ
MENNMNNNQDNDRNDNDRNDNDRNELAIFRYKLDEEFISELYQFSKIHQYDHRKDFKEAWNIWVEDNTEIINKEISRLTELDYKGIILDKMFKSARYYFRNKSTEKKDPKKRKVYVGIQTTLLEEMDKYILTNKNKPSTGFDNFCKENIELLQKEVTNLYKNGITDSEEIKNKIKKTYKNRYFMLISKDKKNI